MDKQDNSIKVWGLGSCIDCGRIFVFNAAKGFQPEDSKICRDCIDKINGLRELDGLPPLGAQPGEPEKTYN